MTSITASHLSDAGLVAELKRLSQSEREVTVTLIIHLAELEARRLHLAAGFSSLFLYCTEVLRLSEAEAYNRMQAARVARRLPRVVDMLLDRSLNLTTVKLLAPELTEENHVGLLDEAANKSKWEVQKLLARHSPRPDMPPSIRKLPSPGPAAVLLAAGPTAEVQTPALHRPPPLPLPPPSRMSNERSGFVTAAGVPSWPGADAAATSGASLSSTISGPSRGVVRRPSPTSRCAVGPTTATRPSFLLAASSRSPRWIPRELERLSRLELVLERALPPQ